jgi:hypothetical protein
MTERLHPGLHGPDLGALVVDGEADLKAALIQPNHYKYKSGNLRK